MLTRLHVRNLAVLDDVTLEFRNGFSVLTGETGTGKSMLVDALALALGSRADSSAVRSGADRTEVSASFDLGPTSTAAAWLRQHDLDSDGDCVLRRVVGSEGRSRAYINGRPVPIEMLRDVGGQLVEICGQHAYQSLGQRPTQRELLDAYGDHPGLRHAVLRAHASWSSLQAEWHRLQSTQRDQRAREDLLRHQVRELSGLGLQPGEIEALEQEHRILANAGQLAAGVAQALERLYDTDEGSAYGIVGMALRELRELAEIDPALAPTAATLEEAGIGLREAAGQLRRRLDAIEHDPGRLAAVETRIAAAQELARKHRIPTDQLSALQQALQAELDGIDASDDQLRTLGSQLAACEQQLRDAAAALSLARQQAAATFSIAVSEQLAQLGMPGSTLVVRLEPLPDGQCGAWGKEQVEFLVATNPGQPPGPVARVASGGELSRLSLAIQAVSIAGHGAPTLIFDEVDAGIGGSAAEIVGKCLHRLSDRHQVICVTHLPQVASQADHHFAVAKEAAAGQSQVRTRELDGRGRVEEIARMLGGITITERTRAHAREMLRSSGSRRTG